MEVFERLGAIFLLGALVISVFMLLWHLFALFKHMRSHDRYVSVFISEDVFHDLELLMKKFECKSVSEVASAVLKSGCDDLRLKGLIDDAD